MGLGHRFSFGTASLVHSGIRDLGSDLRSLTLDNSNLNTYVLGTMLGTSGEIDMNMIWTVSVNDYRKIGQVL